MRQETGDWRLETGDRTCPPWRGQGLPAVAGRITDKSGCRAGKLVLRRFRAIFPPSRDDDNIMPSKPSGHGSRFARFATLNLYPPRRTQPLPLRRPAAFTLVEVTVAMALGAFVLMALLGMSMAALRTGRIATDDTFVGTIAQDVMTDLRVTSFDSLSGRSGQVVRCDRDGVLEGYAGYDGDPYYRLTIHIGDLPPTNYLKEVRLEVVWPVSVTPPPETNWYGTKIARKENL